MPRRLSSAEAGELVQSLIPKMHSRLRVLEAIAQSVRIANQVAPSKWGIRINQKSIMLKVGFVETLTVSADWFHELVERRSIPTKLFKQKRVKFTLRPYKNAPGCDASNVDSDFTYAVEVYSRLFPAHTEAIRIAGKRHRRADTLKDHSPGLINYISRELKIRLPQPSWLDEGVPLPEEISTGDYFYAGAGRRVLVNRYERDPQARALCIERYGSKCFVCGLLMADSYGPAATGLIHVHHLQPVSTHHRRVRIDPVRDLRPLCPNCHAVIHSVSPPFSIRTVQTMLRSSRR
jgi:5-methylcytosine-specific restriction enzyme A